MIKSKITIDTLLLIVDSDHVMQMINSTLNQARLRETAQLRSYRRDCITGRAWLFNTTNKMKTLETSSFTQFAARYCKRQEQTEAGLREVLLAQKARFNPDGWFMLECQMMDSSKFGSLTILPWGPNNTYKAIPEHPVSPRGLASDMSIVCAILPVEAVAA